MEEILNNSQPVAARPDAHAEPELRRSINEPTGVLRKNLKPTLYLVAAGVVILAAVFSGVGKKSPAGHAAPNHEPPQPAVQDNTDNNVQTLKSNVAEARQRAAQQSGAIAGQDPAMANATHAQQIAAAGYSASGEAVQCAPGENCPLQQNGYGQQGGQQLSPAQQEAQQLAAKERELAYNARFASNLVYARTPEAHAQQAAPAGPESAVEASSQQNPNFPTQATSSLVQGRTAGDPPAPASASAQQSNNRRPQVNIDSAVGQPYVIYEGLTLDTVLMNRLDGDAAGPVKVLVSNSVYSHDRQHVLIPDGTIVLGEAKKIGSDGFGRQRRMSVVFHRMIMPDGYSVDLDQFHGLDQIGEEGLKDKVNNHYFQIFGASIALGIISGAAQITQGGGTITTNGSQAYATGAAGSLSQSASNILDRFIQIPPTITIREGHRVKVYFTQDMLLPAYENHTIPQTF
jgi:type IV secretion system protein VirB10